MEGMYSGVKTEQLNLLKNRKNRRQHNENRNRK